MPSVDTIIDQLQERTGRLEERVKNVESELGTVIDRVQGIHDNTTRILAIAEGVSRTLVALAGFAVFVATVVGLYKALVA